MTNTMGPVRPTRAAVNLLLKAGWTVDDILRQAGYSDAELTPLKLQLNALQNELKYGGKRALQETMLLIAAKESKQ